MPVWKLIDEVIFPDPSEAEPDGLLAVGGDLRPERLLAAYAAMKSVYAHLADGFHDTSRTPADWSALQQDLHATIGLDKLLAIEKATVEK